MDTLGVREPSADGTSLYQPGKTEARASVLWQKQTYGRMLIKEGFGSGENKTLLNFECGRISWQRQRRR